MSRARDTRAGEQELAFLEGVRRRCPDHLPVLEALGHLYTELDRCEQGLEVDRLLVERDPANETNWYNLACSLARTGDPDGAMDALRRAVELGYDDAGWMLRDEDLAAVRDRQDFRTLVAALRTG
jgi:DNA-binding SARP family transcriptional activator